jgi:hypothetical protein
MWTARNNHDQEGNLDKKDNTIPVTGCGGP